MIPTLPAMETPALAHWAHAMQRSVLRQMIAIVSRPGILSFAGGLPDPALFPATEYAAAVTNVLTTDPKALQYGPPSAALKAHIVDLVAERGITCNADSIFISTGAQQMLDVFTRLFVNPGDLVILEENIYTGMQQALSPFQPHIVTVPTDLQSGINIGRIEQLLSNGARPAFFYVIPDGHNPLGVSMSLDKRYQLVALARQFQIPIIEDDPYGFLNYDGERLPTLRSLEPNWVFYTGSFSKILAPGLRLGWTIAPEWLIPKLTVVKEASDLETSALTQRAVAAYLDTGHLPTHLDLLRTTYRQRRDTMLVALEEHFPANARWTIPSGGMFIWVELDDTIDCADFLQLAIEQEQVAFIPGFAFAVKPGLSRNCLRLNFSNCSVTAIEDGIGRLGRVLQQYHH
ncbi:MAG: PLP-dependent aminotransferase family protein [Anaerolineae bacterium]|nr:PLP-dependent aminotransferase family protein [Anaerolineae bacterium]MCO5196282.1 PLP-dependent aminotransferase family protein [Anaerolineae bacterium]